MNEQRYRRYGALAWAGVGILLFAAIIYAGLSAVSTFIVPLIVAAVLGAIFQPIAALLSRRMPRQVASVIVLVGLVAMIIVSVVVVVVGILDQWEAIARQFRNAIDRGEELLGEGGAETITVAEVQDRLSDVLGDVIPGLATYVPSVISQVSSFIAGTFIALFILYFVLAEWDALTDWVGRHLGVPDDLGAGIVRDATRSFRDYFYVLTLSSIPVAVTVGLAAFLMGLPLAFTIGLVTLVTSYVPYLGALVSGLFALLIAFGAGGPLAALIMVIVVLVAQNVVQPIIQRQLERNTMDIHPIVSFGSTIVGSVVAGVLGATLSAPFVAMVLRIRQRVAAHHVDVEESSGT